MRKEQASILKILSKDLVFHPKKSSPKNIHRVIINTKNHTVSDMNNAKDYLVHPTFKRSPIFPSFLSSVPLRNIRTKFNMLY